jgi:hypothetical protein
MTEIPEKAEAHAAAAEKKWVDKLATAASALIALGTLASWFFGSHTQFPRWFFYVLTALVVVIVYKYFENTLRGFIQAISLRSYLRQQHFQLLDFLQRFGELVTTHGDDSIVVMLQKISDRKGQDVVDRDLFAYPELFMSNIMVRLSEPGRQPSAGEVKGVLNDLSNLIRFSAHFYFKKPLHVKGIPDLSKEEKKSLDLARENFADFVRRFQTFYDEVNVRLGSASRAHFEIPKPLSA